MKFKARFEDQIKLTPSVGDNKPLGTGVLNRHGMPVVSIGQTITKNWPVPDLGTTPDILPDKCRLVINGEVDTSVTFTWDVLMALPQTADIADFHCVTTWSKLDKDCNGLQLPDLAALVHPKDTATHIMCYGYDGYSTNLSLEEALKNDVLLVPTFENAPVPKEHGAPLRMITPKLYAWKGSKWISRIEFLPKDRLGFWEEKGYSSAAYPWRNDRYS